MFDLSSPKCICETLMDSSLLLQQLSTFLSILVELATIIHKIFETKWCTTGKAQFVFQEICTSTDKIFISGGLRTRYIPHKVLKCSWYCLIYWHPKFYIVQQLVYNILLVIITFRFNCGEKRNCATIKKSQNIMNMIVWKVFFCFLCLD